MGEAVETGEHTLKRTLGAGSLVALGIGAIIGTGIFVLTGPAAARYAGPAVVYSFIVAAVGCVFAGLCYAEFAAMIPVAGSAYTYGYATLGEIFAWIIGWDLVLEYAFGAATVCSGWSGYVLSLGQDFGLRLPPELAGTPGSVFVLYNGNWEFLGRVAKKLAVLGIDPATLPQRHGDFNLVAFLGILMVTTILVIGIRESANFNSLIVVIKLVVLLIFLAIGGVALLHHPELPRVNWHPFLPPNTGSFGSFGWSGVLRGAGVIFFAYIGFDAVSTAAQEAKTPKRDMPIGILGSLVLCTILYILVALVLTGLVNYHYLNVPDSLAVGIDVTGVKWGSLLVKLGALRWTHQHHDRDVARPEPCLLRHVEGRSSANNIQQYSPSIPHPVDLFYYCGRSSRGLCIDHPSGQTGRDDQHRHPARLYHRLRGRVGASLPPSRAGAGRSVRRFLRSPPSSESSSRWP